MKKKIIVAIVLLCLSFKWDAVVYLSAGLTLHSASHLAYLGWGICQCFPWGSSTGNECRLLGTICTKGAKHSIIQAFQARPNALGSWQQNQNDLQQIPAVSVEDQKLLSFLENRWLAKSTGFYPTLIHWICPCFDISFQVHPQTTNSYARDPQNKSSETYLSRIMSWKKILPHPKHYPLILTRPYALQDYLPNYFAVIQEEAIVKLFENKIDNPVVLDLTDVFGDETDPAQFQKKWNKYQCTLNKACQSKNIPTKNIICIQRVKQDEIGGIRLLVHNESLLEEQEQFLLERISKFGLTANRIELDRWSKESCTNNDPYFAPISFNWDNNLFLEENCSPDLMVQGAINLLRGLNDILTEDKWKTVKESPTKSLLVNLSFLKIKEEFSQIKTYENNFYDTASHIESIHSHVSALLEIFSPFKKDDFSIIYSNLLNWIPDSLKISSFFGLHSSGMTSLSGIFQAVQSAVQKTPLILYGENTYFENITAAEMKAVCKPIENATSEDLENVDLILGQFNPALRRIDFKVTDYCVENIAKSLRSVFEKKRTKPLTLALDCTLDFIHSSKVSQLIEEFQEEIVNGKLNIICYRSGLKFDLFGMDNYCGAPIFMLHNSDSKWDIFDSTLKAPVLAADRLSLNWFCLAYQNAAPQLEQYRKQVFDNTRSLLDQIAPRLYQQTGLAYRVVPIDPHAEAAFVDIKILGPMHTLRSSLIAGYLTFECMENKHPLFYRPGIGFYHPNLCVLFGEDCSTIRLTLGLDPAQVDVLVNCFKTIDSLNSNLTKI